MHLFLLLLQFQLLLIKSSYSWIWPVSRSNVVDLRQSSPFGPRLKTSENLRYDFHRGIDIPAPLNSSLYAVHGGTVRIAGSHASYSDTVLQIRHTIDSINYYSTYLHLNTVYVNVDDVVTEGQFVATSGETPSLPHLHFEIRKNGLYQRNCINPWTYLPYPDTNNHEVSVPHVREYSLFGGGDIVYNITVMVTCPHTPTELDFDLVYLTAYDVNDVQLSGMNRYNLSFNEINLEQTFVPTNIAILDRPYIPSRNVYVQPFRYNGLIGQYPVAGWNFTFFQVMLPPNTCKIKAHAVDLSNNEKTAALITVSTTGSCAISTTSSATSMYERKLCDIYLLILISMTTMLMH